jgi:hypothetical protein
VVSNHNFEPTLESNCKISVRSTIGGEGVISFLIFFSLTKDNYVELEPEYKIIGADEHTNILKSSYVSVPAGSQKMIVSCMIVTVIHLAIMMTWY